MLNLNRGREEKQNLRIYVQEHKKVNWFVWSLTSIS